MQHSYPKIQIKYLSKLLIAFGIFLIIVIPVLTFVPRVSAQIPPAGMLCMYLKKSSFISSEGCKSISSMIGPGITKTPTNATLVGNNTVTTVTLRFQVFSTSATGITNTVMHERFAQYFSFANPPDIKLNGNPVAGLPNLAGRSSADIPLGYLAPGQYSLTFRIQINGSAPEGTYPIEQSGGTCSDPNARIDFRNALGQPDCDILPPGSIVRRFPKIIINADSWIGDKDVVAGNKLKVGNNTLVVSGKSAQTNGKNVSNYSLPSVGKLAWVTMERTMRQRIKQAVETGVAKYVSDCPNDNPLTPANENQVSALYLDSQGSSPFSNYIPPSSPKKQLWVVDNCSITLRNAVFYGSGTIINVDLNDTHNKVAAYNGGALNIYGRLAPYDQSSKNTFGYVALRDGSNSYAGQVNLQGDAAPMSVAVFTNGVVEMGNNNTPDPISRQIHLIARTLRFPPYDSMLNDIIFDTPSAVYANVPLLFQQLFSLNGREVP